MSQPGNQMPEAPAVQDAPPPHEQAPTEEPARLGPLSRLIGTLLSPGETFADINRKPTWIAPMIIVLVTGLAASVFLEWRVKPDWERFFRTQVTKALERSGRTVPPEQIDQQVAFQVKFAKTDFSSPLSILLTLLKLVLYVVFSCVVPAGIFGLGLMFMQAKTTFKKILSVVSWSTAATGLVGALVFMASLMVRDPESLRDVNPTEITSLVPTNLGVILPSDVSPAIASIAGSLDIFTIWLLILFTIGFATISGARNMSSSKTGKLVFGLWIVWVLIKAAGAALFFRR